MKPFSILAFQLFSLLLLCGCAGPQMLAPGATCSARRESPAPAPIPPKVIRWAWQCGNKESTFDANNNIIAAQLPKWSGLEGTSDFVHWFTETNLLVTHYDQWFVVALPANEHYRFYRAVDRYQ